MSTTEKKAATKFEKVGECLYRYQPNGVYYARLKREGKQISFRRLFITRALEKGVDVKVIAEWQGHKDGGKLILDTYSHVNRAHAKKMADLMVTDESEQTA